MVEVTTSGGEVSVDTMVLPGNCVVMIEVVPGSWTVEVTISGGETMVEVTTEPGRLIVDSMVLAGS